MRRRIARCWRLKKARLNSRAAHRATTRKGKMMETEPKVCSEGKIWDLHIHSNQCSSYKGRQKDASISEYVDDLAKLFQEFPNLEMISFTDHNQMCYELYKECMMRDSFPTVLPGVEVDVQLAEGGKSKHLVVYFDCASDSKKMEALSEQLNDYFSSHQVGPSNPVPIDNFLNELLELRVPFTLSPHAMKQNERAIDYDWHSMKPSERDTYKYVDQFFSFWETSGKSNLAYAVEFLEDMNCGDRVSVVVFSDSHSIEELRAYLENPPQYFYALPNYMGLRLVGTDVSRVFEDSQELPFADKGKYIGSIAVSGSEITLSPRLNAIIGGRGSGKSILLDALARSLASDNGAELPKGRIEYLDKRKVVPRNLAGGPIARGSFSFEYFNQSYIANIFNLEGQAYSDALMRYFKNAFDEVEDIDQLSVAAENISNFTSLFEEVPAVSFSNISGLVEKYVVDRNDSLNIQIKKGMKRKTAKELANFDYLQCLDKVNREVDKSLPKFLRGNKEIELAISELDKTILEQSGLERMRYLSAEKPVANLVDTFHAKKDELSKAQAKRNEVESEFENAFVAKALNLRNRVALIKAYLAAERGFRSRYRKHRKKPGKEKDAFRFIKALDVSSPIEYFMHLCNECFTVEKVPTANRNLDHLEDYINAFCFNEGGYRSGYSWETLYNNLKKFNLTYTSSMRIEYMIDGEYVDISTQSPGTQANMLLEYIVHSDSSVPLLIDQPEDNVDNQTIFRDIRDWFSKIKMQRQVIVVTHDANIVINADAENVIIANQERPGRFVYRNGALEYSDNIDEAAKILDGGKLAVKRRLMKYGE